MGDAVVIIVLLVAIGLVAWPRARRWLRNGQASHLVDPDQNITVDPIDGLVGIYETNYHPRRLPRGRRNPAPPGAVIHHRSAMPADGRGKANSPNVEGRGGHAGLRDN